MSSLLCSDNSASFCFVCLIIVVSLVSSFSSKTVYIANLERHISADRFLSFCCFVTAREGLKSLGYNPLKRSRQSTSASAFCRAKAIILASFSDRGLQCFVCFAWSNLALSKSTCSKLTCSVPGLDLSKPAPKAADISWSNDISFRTGAAVETTKRRICADARKETRSSTTKPHYSIRSSLLIKSA